MISKGQNAQKNVKDSWKPLNYKKSTLVRGGTEMPQWTDSEFEMVMENIVKKHVNKKKRSEYFSSKGFPTDRLWSPTECKTALGYGIKHDSVKECLFELEQYWGYKLRHMEDKLAEAEGKILELTTESKMHKTASLNAQRTCKKLQQSLTEVEQLHANCKPKCHGQPGQPCYTEDENPPMLHGLYPDMGAFCSLSDEDSESTQSKVFQMRPVTIRSAEVLNRGGEVKETRVQIGHIPLDAATLDRLSKEFKHPRVMGLDFIDLIEKKKNLYSLHPNDAVAIASQVLNITDSRKLANKVLYGLGDNGQDINKGWEAFKEWISHKCRKTTDWGQISNCKQRKGESAAEYCDRFERVFLRHCGIDTYNNDSIDCTTEGPHFGQLVDSLQPDLRQALVTAVPNWRKVKWGELKSELDRLDLDLEYPKMRENTAGRSSEGFPQDDTIGKSFQGLSHDQFSMLIKAVQGYTEVSTSPSAPALN
uniref:Retrotransposon gag domain-containing protein n=1 Tax=Pygocentrus nattereri TaxID=42514 RepID=A0AAR2LTU3_PYGNA